MPRFETPSRRDTGEKKKPNLFQRLGKNKGPEAQQATEKPKPIRKLKEILKHASTPKERELAQKDNELKKETRGLLDGLRNIVEPERRRQIRELRETVIATPDIRKNKEAVRAYQELIKVTDPERFAREIGEVDGIYGPKTRKAYEADKETLDNPRPAILSALSSNTPKETPEARNERTKGSGGLRNLFNANNIDGKRDFGVGNFQSLPAEIVRDGKGRVVMTYCSRTARKNLARLGLGNVPQPNSAIDTLSYYKSGNYNITGLSTGGFNPPPEAEVADIVMSTGGRHGHRSMAREGRKDWLVYDPYMNGSTSGIPLNQYKAMLKARGWNIEGAAFYDSGNVA